jgi:TolA-binding protein
MQYDAMQYRTAPPYQSAKKRLGNYALFLLSAGIAFAVLAVAALGVFVYFGGEYGKAETSIENKDFKPAQGYLLKVPAFYKDAPKLIVYAQAGEALAGGQFDRAKAFYITLGNFRDSAAMNTETDYRKAAALLDQSDFDGARQMFSALAQAGYKDSATMVTEADYRRAASLVEKKDYKGAIEAYLKLGDYKESADKAKGAASEAFEAAVSQYRAGKYEDAKQGFGIVEKYNPDADKYLTLIEAHAVTVTQSNTNYVSTKTLFGKLAGLGDFEDAEKIEVSEVFLLYKLEGNWYQSNGDLYVDFTYNTFKSGWFFLAGTQPIDGIQFKASAGSIYKYVNGGWLEMNRFQFLGENSINLQWIINASVDSTVPLYRH